MSDSANKILGRYQLLVAVARGGMGQVWLARLQGARGFSKLVAVKTLLPNQEDRARLEGMLAEEARLASLIQHANVVHTMELGEHEDMLYLVMEWVDGEPLGFLLDRAKQRGGMPLGIAVALVSQVLSGLHAAHELSDESGPLGVVHRDVSPHNILVTYDGIAKLLDFGIAKATHQASSSTETGEIKGKFSYMAPEQILGNDVDRRCDVFAASIVLYLMTTGRHPFKHHNTAAVIHAITTDEPVAPPSSLVENFPKELERVLLKGLEKDVEKRWSSAEEMRNALEQAMPDAFGDTGRYELRAFMERAVGDRKVARREAVRRAQLTADGRDVETGARRALQASAQSASSLRAISISQPAPEDLPELIIAESSSLSQAVEPRARRIPRAPWLVATAGVLFALGATLPRLFAPHAPPQAATAAGVQAGASLTPAPPSSAGRSRVLEPAPQLAAPEPSPLSAVAAAPETAPPAKGAAHPPGKSARGAKPVSAKLPTAKPKPSGQTDLLAPDYAH
jgi:eukaryotic-like serine/threonine-protein kinase